MDRSASCTQRADFCVPREPFLVERTMPIVVSFLCVCVYFVTFEPVPGEKEREEDKEHFTGRERAHFRNWIG